MRHLKTFEMVKVIAASKSIRGAADQLAISSSALNRRIQNLEHEIGFSIFEKTHAGVTLSTAGEEFLRFALSQINGFKVVESRVADLRGARIGDVQIAIGHDIYPSGLFRLIAAHGEKHPGVHFELCTVDDSIFIRDGLSEDFDFGLFCNPRLAEDNAITASAPAKVTCRLAADDPLANQENLRLYDIHDRPLVLPPRQSVLTNLLNTIASRSSLKLNTSIFCEATAQSPACRPANGVMLGLEPAGSASDIDGDDVAYLCDPPFEALQLQLINPNTHRKNVAAARFQDELLQFMEDGQLGT